MDNNTSVGLGSQLEMLGSVYEKAKARLAGTDPEWEVRKEAMLRDMFTKVKTFQPDDRSSKAVFIIGRIQSAATEMDQPKRIVAEYEGKRKRYVELCNAEGKQPNQY